MKQHNDKDRCLKTLQEYAYEIKLAETGNNWIIVKSSEILEVKHTSEVTHSSP